MYWTSKCRKIVAIGRNYAEHAKELGNAIPTKPMFFLKPPSSFLHAPNNIELPIGAVVHHEIELAVIIGKTGRNIPQAKAMEFVNGYSLALDLTARNIQEEARRTGNPWTESKGFDTFTPIGERLKRSSVLDPNNLKLLLVVNGKVLQNGSTSDMIFKIPKLIEYVSSIMTLEEGDVILTGTPAGVGPIFDGQILKGSLSDSSGLLSTFEFNVRNRSPDSR